MKPLLLKSVSPRDTLPPVLENGTWEIILITYHITTVRCLLRLALQQRHVAFASWSRAESAAQPKREEPLATIAPAFRALFRRASNCGERQLEWRGSSKLTTQYTEHAISFIREHAEQPFFVYLPHSMVHVPLYVSDKFAGKSGAGLFGDVMMEVDWSVGQLIDTLDELKLSEHTLFIFTSDNGPWLSYGDHAGSAKPLREGKGTMFEGGYRVPTLMRWTDAALQNSTIPPDTSCDKLASTIDLLPTITKLIDTKMPALPIDGKDIRPLMFGDSGAVSPHDYFYCYYGNDELQAIRTERWKLHFPHRYTTLNGRPGGHDGIPEKYEPQAIGEVLYDLENDVQESRDVAAEHPEMVAQLKAAAAIARADLGDTLVPTVGKGTRRPGQVPSTPTER